MNTVYSMEDYMCVRALSIRFKIISKFNSTVLPLDVTIMRLLQFLRIGCINEFIKHIYLNRGGEIELYIYGTHTHILIIYNTPRTPINDPHSEYIVRISRK